MNSKELYQAVSSHGQVHRSSNSPIRSWAQQVLLAFQEQQVPQVTRVLQATREPQVTQEPQVTRARLAPSFTMAHPIQT